MIESMEYFRIYHKTMEQLKELSAEQIGHVVLAASAYSMGEELPELDAFERLVFISLRQSIDCDTNAYNRVCAKNKANGEKGGRPRKEEKPSGFSENPKKPTVFSKTQKTQTHKINKDNILPPNDNNLSNSSSYLNYHHIPPQGEGGVCEAEKNENKNENENNATLVKDEKAEAFEKEKSSAKKEKDWRTDFALYQEQAYKAYTELLQDREWIAEREKFNPNVNVALSLEKAYAEYWGTEAGWKKKKQSRSAVIDWRRTYTNAISMNKVYKPRSAPTATGVEDYHVELNNKTKF